MMLYKPKKQGKKHVFNSSSIIGHAVNRDSFTSPQRSRPNEITDINEPKQLVKGMP